MKKSWSPTNELIEQIMSLKGVMELRATVIEQVPTHQFTNQQEETVLNEEELKEIRCKMMELMRKI